MPRPKITYRNDSKLKKAGITMDYTPEQIKELKDCHDNIYHFAEKYFEIVTLDADAYGERRKIIKVRDYQKRILDSVTKNRFTCVLSPRQIGKTTLLRLITLYYACFEKDFEIVIASNKEKTSIKTLRKIKESYKSLPMWLKPGVVKWDEKEIRFDNGSAIYASATSEDGCRGDSVNLLVLDEFAHIPNRLADEFFTSIYPVVTEGKDSKIVILSTPSGMSGPYYEIWVKAKRGLNRFNAVEVKWDEPPNRDSAFKATVIADIGMRRWLQEYECKFTGSSDTLISTQALEQMLWCDEFTSDDTGFAKVYKKPVPNHIYSAGLDVSEGINKECSVIHIFDVTDTQHIEEVFVWRSNTVITQLLSDYVLQWCRYYNDAWIMLESNNIGDGTANTLWYDEEYEKFINYGKHSNLGIRSTRTSKVKSALHMKYLIETGRVKINDKDTIAELSTFIDYGHQIYKADAGNMDDLVTSMNWALFISHSEIADTVDIDPVAHNENMEGSTDAGEVHDRDPDENSNVGEEDAYGMVGGDDVDEWIRGGEMTNRQFNEVFR